MPDIAMCMGENCAIKELCYRYRAIPSEYKQAYFTDSPYKDDNCDAFERFDETVPVRTMDLICVSSSMVER